MTHEDAICALAQDSHRGVQGNAQSQADLRLVAVVSSVIPETVWGSCTRTGDSGPHGVGRIARPDGLKPTCEPGSRASGQRRGSRAQLVAEPAHRRVALA